jgi:hypothetical protein
MALFHQSIEEPIYCFPLAVVVGPLDEVRAWLERTHPQAEFALDWRDDAAARVIEHQDDDGLLDGLWIWFPPKPQEVIDACVHEAVHIGSKVLRAHGLRLNKHTEDAYAYYIEFVSRALRQALTTYASRKRKTR